MNDFFPKYTRACYRRTEYQEKEFNDRGAHGLTDSTDNNTQRKQPWIPTSSPASFLDSFSLQLWTKQFSFVKTASRETTSHTCPNNMLWHHLPQPPAAPLFCHRRCFKTTYDSYFIYIFSFSWCSQAFDIHTHTSQPGESISAERKWKPFPQNSSWLPFTWGSNGRWLCFLCHIYYYHCVFTNKPTCSNNRCTGNWIRKI